jgi:hypothetical protein
VNGPAGIRTIGAPSNPRLASVDETACPAVEGCGSAAPRQIAHVMKLIPVHNIVRCPSIATSIVGQCIQHR